mmetsp:Transcript_47378/g.103149  ORF Transcript_47378/g.103149 Transcript_47378/m.103149 type:complete len:203 (-) Transcript_47378:9-617(-)
MRPAADRALARFDKEGANVATPNAPYRTANNVDSMTPPEKQSPNGRLIDLVSRQLALMSQTIIKLPYQKPRANVQYIIMMVIAVLAPRKTPARMPFCWATRTYWSYLSTSVSSPPNAATVRIDPIACSATPPAFAYAPCCLAPRVETNLIITATDPPRSGTAISIARVSCQDLMNATTKPAMVCTLPEISVENFSPIPSRKS